jgi:hypothetical protein
LLEEAHDRKIRSDIVIRQGYREVLVRCTRVGLEVLLGNRRRHLGGFVGVENIQVVNFEIGDTLKT